MKRSHLFILTLLFIIYPDVNSQSRNYNYEFKNGQTLGFEHIVESVDTLTNVVPVENNRVIRKQRVKFLDFKVMGVNHQGYKMSMNIASSYSRTEYLQGFGGRPDRFETAFDSTAYALVNYADQGREFNFEMDAKGKVIQIEGIEDFQNEVIQKIHNMGRQSMKTKIRYEYILSRINEVYYISLINDIFPDMSGMDKENRDAKLKMEVSGRGLEISNNWKSVENNPTQLLFTQEYSAILKEKVQSWESSYGELFWNSENASPDSVVCIKTNYQDVIKILWDIDNIFSYQFDFTGVKSRIESKTISRSRGGYSSKDQSAWIFGEIRGCDSCQAIVHFPTTGLVENETIYEINNQGEKITITGDMPNGPGLVSIYFPEDIEPFRSYRSDPRQIRLFVLPGDTVKFSVDLRKFGQNMRFEGKSWREQELLNNYVLGYSNPNMKIYLEEIQLIREQFEKDKSYYSEEFQDWFDFELFYEELEYKLNDILTDVYEIPEYNSNDSVSNFFRYCNNFTGINSPAYRRFITRFAIAFAAKSGLSVYGSDYTIDLRETAGALLTGWDRYYVMAKLTQARMRTFYTEICERYYKSFISDYKGSEFGNLLEEQWTRYSHLLPGSTIERFDFTDFDGKKYNIRDLAGTLVVVAPSYYMPKKRHRPSLPSFSDEDIKIFLENQMKGIITLLYYIGDEPVNRDSIREYKLENQIYVTDKKSVQRIRESFADRSDLVFTIDKDQRIATIGVSGKHGFPPFNLKSWPQLVDPIDPPETINRNIIWYTSGGLIIIGFIIFIILKIRSKRREERLAIRRKMAELELGAVKSRMNPHFLFNALGSIQNLVNGNEIDKANLYLAEFGDLVRSILDQSSKDHISLTEELGTLKTYLDLEKLRFPFSYTIKVSDEIQADRIEIPPLFIQPHVENAIIHALSKKGDLGELDIAFYLNGGNLEVIVADNGPGLQSGNISNGLGQGWKLTKQRVELLKEQWGDKISVEMEKNSEKPGMRVKFVIPVENKT